MAYNIVTVNVSQQIAPTPSTLQQTGAFISTGGTNTAAGTKSLLTQLSDLTPLLNAGLALTALSWGSASGGTVTGSVSGTASGIAVGETFTISGCSPAAYNGTFTAMAGTTGNVVVYALTPNPGVATTLGTMTNGSAAELTQMATTYFAQQSPPAVYMLELGAGAPTAAVAYLTAWITANPGVFYSYLVPRAWDNNAAFLALLASFEATTSKTYFFITTTVGTYGSYTALMKCAYTLIEAPGIPATEFSLASNFCATLRYNPSSTNKVTVLAYTFVFGVTPYPTAGNAALLQTLKNAGVNIIATGSQGGISTAMILWGTTMDLRPFNYWYSVDWAQINVALNMTNAVINGSNNPTNPLYLDQPGINALQAVAASTMATAVTVGLALGAVVQSELNSTDFAAARAAGQFVGQADVNAVPFTDYYAANPGDYKIGTYNGYSITYTPLRGFESITVNIVVTDFVAG